MKYKKIKFRKQLLHNSHLYKHYYHCFHKKNFFNDIPFPCRVSLFGHFSCGLKNGSFRIRLTNSNFKNGLSNGSFKMAYKYNIFLQRWQLKINSQISYLFFQKYINAIFFNYLTPLNSCFNNFKLELFPSGPQQQKSIMWNILLVNLCSQLSTVYLTYFVVMRLELILPLQIHWT